MDLKKYRPNRILKPQGINTAVANGTTTSGLRVQFPNKGKVLFAVGCPVGVNTNDAYQSGLSSLAFRLQVKGVAEIVTDFESAQFVVFASAFPSAGFRFPIGREVEQNDTWFVFIKNLHAATTFTPDFAFGICEEYQAPNTR